MRALAILVLLAGTAAAQPGGVPSVDPAVALRDANAAATAGDWARVSATVRPLLARQLDRADLAEAHRLAGIAALLSEPRDQEAAEQHFLEYLRIELDGHLDPALYPPEVLNVFNNVRAVHSAELKARRPKAKRYWFLSLAPPFGQFQNGDKTKGIIVGSLLGTFLVTNLTTFFVLRSWCFQQTGDGGSSVGCDGETAPSTNHNSSAATLRTLNITAGVGAIVVYVYGVYDGIRGYRQDSRERALVPYASSSNGTAVIGVHMRF